MHSAIFHEQGPPPQSVYATQQQTQVMGQVSQTLRTPRVHREVVMQSPRDMKATANSGHGVVLTHQMSPGPGVAMNAEGTTIIRQGQNESQLGLVRASREDVGMPREWRNTQTNLQWSDSRAERVSCRGQAPCHMLHVFGTERRVEKSTHNASREICSVELKNMIVAPDSNRDRNSTKTSTGGEASAQKRHDHNLLPSSENQFSVYSPRSPRNDTVSTPPKQRLGKDADDKLLDDKRRKERNFSNLFGKPTGERTGSLTKRTEIHGTANCSFLDSHVEIANRNQNPRTSSPETIYRPKPTCTDTPDRTPQDTRTACEERACWDTRAIMSATSEVARRRREKQGAPGQQLERSASERKRSELTSGQFRQGMGAPRESHDDGRMGPGPLRSTPDLRASRSSSEGKGSFRSYRADSARARKIASLSSSGIF